MYPGFILLEHSRPRENKDLPIFVQIPPTLLKIFLKEVAETEIKAGNDTFTWLRTWGGPAGGLRFSLRVSLPETLLHPGAPGGAGGRGGRRGGAGRGDSRTGPAPGSHPRPPGNSPRPGFRSLPPPALVPPRISVRPQPASPRSLSASRGSLPPHRGAAISGQNIQLSPAPRRDLSAIPSINSHRLGWPSGGPVPQFGDRVAGPRVPAASRAQS